MASVKLKFRPSAVQGKKGALYYQIIHKGKVKHIVSRYRLSPQEWDGTCAEVRRASRIWEKVRNENGLLNGVVERLEAAGKEYTAEDVVLRFHALRDSCSLCGYVHSLVVGFRECGRMRLSEIYMSALASFMRFRKGADVRVGELSHDMMMDYQNWLKASGLSMNTVSFYLRVLRAVYNKAVDKGLAVQQCPFRAVYTGVARTVKRAVPVDTVRAIKDLSLPEMSSVGFARDMFMFSFYTRGMSFVDMAYLRKTDIRNGVLSYRRRKTGQRLHVRWENCMQEIVDRYGCRMSPDSGYLLPIIRKIGNDDRKQYKNSLFKVNRKLKEIGRQVGMSHPLTMYVARHSWASIARSRNIPLQVISEGLGHDSDKTTYIYLASIEASEVDDANRRIIDLL